MTNAPRASDEARPFSAPLLSVPDVALRCCVSERTVLRWISSGALVAHRLGDVIRVSEADLAAFLNTCRGSD